MGLVPDFTFKRAFLWLLFFGVLVGSLFALFAVDQGKDDILDDVSRLRDDPNAPVQLPNDNIQVARATLAWMAGIVGGVLVLVFLPVILRTLVHVIDAAARRGLRDEPRRQGGFPLGNV